MQQHKRYTKVSK